MEIRLLGTSSAEGMPALFCRCDVCRYAREYRGKDLRTRTSALIDGRLKIDLPPDTLCHVQYQGLDLLEVENLLFTHAHDDHCDAPELQYMSWMFVPEVLTRTLHVYGPIDAITRLTRALDLTELPIALHCLSPWEPIPLGDYEVTPALAKHDPRQCCFNYVIERDGKALLYATDTGWYSESTWAFLKTVKLDGAVIECSKGLSEEGYSGHLSIPEVIRARERLVSMGTLPAAAPVVTTHHSHLSGLTHNDLERELAPHGITVGYDGLAFTI